ncbi:MAG: long-chain fatty acid--CoA ligase [Planctomycetes bacterium]|nr:long-chain fatty acid--CoA ligase [Planctomycetota bacterium]
MGINLAFALHHNAEVRPRKTAIVFEDTNISYAEAGLIVRKFAKGLLDLGVKPKDKVALLCPNTPHFPLAYYAILSMGATVVPVNVLSSADEIAYALDDSDATALISFQMFAQQASQGFAKVDHTKHHVILTNAPWKEIPAGAIDSSVLLAKTEGHLESIYSPDFDQTAVILYTSGTTGKPKGAELTHSNLFDNVIVCTHILPMNDSSNVLVVLPLFHSFGQTCGMNATFYRGGTIDLMPRFDAKAVLSRIEKRRINLFHAVPTMYFQMIEAAKEGNYDVSSLEYCCSGGAALPEAVLKTFEKMFGVTMLEGYGLSETAPVACFNQLHRERKSGSIGVPVFGVEMDIFDDEGNRVPTGERGEIVIKGHCIMKGYYGKIEETKAVMTEDGWFRTGDIGIRDAEGYYFIVDRKKEMIIRGGFNVYPREIEECLYKYPSIVEAACIGLPDEEYGEEVHAYIAFAQDAGAETRDIANIDKYAREHLGKHKYPRHYHVLDALPKGPTGKILKRELKQQALK